MKIAQLAGLGLVLACTSAGTANTSEPAFTAASRAVFTAKATAATDTSRTWRLVFSDEFKSSGKFDGSKWKYAERGNAAWTRFLTSSPDYVHQRKGNLVVRMDNAKLPADPLPYHSGGITTSSKFSARYGKVEVRAKFNEGKGSWPAIWMMPELPTAYGGWPASGEIDIMEHVNKEPVVHQTIHNAAVTDAKGGSTATRRTAHRTNAYNTYGIEWGPDSLEFFVNGVKQYTYAKKAGASSREWPFDRPFYIILNQSGAVGWPGPANDEELPFEMQVDWVRVYKQNELVNGDFETNHTAWVLQPGAEIVGAGRRTGKKALRLAGSATSATQTVSGLRPNTTYALGGYGRLKAKAGAAVLGVKNYGGAPVEINIHAKNDQTAQVTFTTGPDQTSATVYVSKPGNGTVFIDDLYLNKQ